MKVIVSEKLIRELADRYVHKEISEKCYEDFIGNASYFEGLTLESSDLVKFIRACSIFYRDAYSEGQEHWYSCLPEKTEEDCMDRTRKGYIDSRPWVVLKVGGGYTVARNGIDGTPESDYRFYWSSEQAQMLADDYNKKDGIADAPKYIEKEWQN